MATITVTNVLGEALPATHFYGDGSYDCPHCGYAVRADTGFSLREHNPWCFAHPEYPLEKAVQERAKQQAKQQEEAQHRKNHQWTMERIERQRKQQAEEQAAKVQAARQRGVCITCLVRSNFRKEVKHRKGCPYAQKIS